ncbi:MAG: hypothetical protein HF981_24145 [Desulfobacteraceae bacterium]|nr:hypothetical protein [Desulfobacteraceae bacterium]MBC2753508.1 hypothetical protein [Desulfobacteraceae bacterium]
MMVEFLPKEFEVPKVLEVEEFRLEVLRPDVAEIDYDAVMSSKQRLRQVFSSATEWPRDDMTLAENRDDLKRHQTKFESRKAFAYTVLSRDRTRCLGCVYIDPCRLEMFDWEVYLWLRDDCAELDAKLYKIMKDWVSECWPFGSIIFPGREVSWSKWESYQ